MQRIVRWCLANRSVVILFSLVLMGAGVVSIFRINQELLPSVQFPTVFILVPDPGTGPDQVDRDVTQPLIAGLTGLPRARHVTTRSSQGFSQVQVDFDLDSALKDDLDAVNQRLQQLQLPSGAGKPLVQTFDFASLPSMTYTLAARDGDLVRATREANDVIVPALTGAQGVAQVRVSGGARQSVLVTLDGGRMAAAGVSASQVQQALTGAQADIPVGESLQSGKSLPVQVVGSVTTLDGLRAVVVGAPAAPGGRPVTLGEVASVTEAPVPVNGISRTDGAPSLQVQVIRAANGNAVSLSDDVRARVARLKLSPGDDLRLVTDAATDIRASLDDLILEGVLGALLAILVIFAFLRSLRATLVTAVSLPTSVLVALLGTSLGGFSLNALTLAGLTVAVGRIVDDAIVVLENSYRHLQQGEPPRQAAFNGAIEVSSAVISSTLTTVAVFLPIGVVGGIISRFFLPFSVTVAISLLASLLVALTLVPVLVSFFLQARPRHARGERRPGALARAYRPALAWALARGWHKAAVLVSAVLLVAGALSTLAFVPRNFFDFGGSTQLAGTVTLPAGTTAAETSARLVPFETAARTDPAVRIVQVTIASSDYGAYTGAFETNTARLAIGLKSKAGAAGVARRLKDELDRLYGAGSSQLGVIQVGPPASGFTASASGRDLVALRAASDMIAARLAGDADLANVKSDLAAEKPELLVTVDGARAAAHGLSPLAVASVVSGALTGREVGTLGPGGPPVTLSLDPSATGAAALPELPVARGVALKDVATITSTLAPVTLNRVDGTQQVTVSADVLSTDTQGVSSRATADLRKLSLPAGVTLVTGGTQTDINDSFRQMFIAIGVAIAIVFLVLVTFFRSVVTPFVILLTMPLAIIGSCLALFVFRQALGLPALLGVLMVFGIVVSNAILLIDFAERNRAGHSLNEALILAGSVRVRPILMTALATIVALVPVAAGVSTAGGAGLISQSLALVVEGGLVSSTFLTLLVIPVVYSLFRRRAGGRVKLSAADAA